jgi:hypothetical protein
LALGTGRESQDANQNLDEQVLKWNGTYYTTILNCLPAGETASAAVSLSRDGQALAVGFPFYGKNGETTIVYTFTSYNKVDLVTTQSSPNYDFDSPFTSYVFEELCVHSNASVRVRDFD